MTAPVVSAERRAEAKLVADQMSAQALAKARLLFPERYAPDGEPLINHAGSDWFERLNTWRVARGQEPIERKKQIHPLPTPAAPINTYSAERQELL